jgi:2-polyprenyl-6-methoxyphenol hydroxylase-like FAD-dependent oxidoreductase
VQRQRIAIIGAGTAGLAAAALLGRDHDVTLIERANALAPVGAGILLQPSGLAAMAQIGCVEQLLDFGQRIDHLHGVSAGRAIMQVRYSDLGVPEAVHGLGVHRAALCHVLDTALQRVPHQRWLGSAVQAIAMSAHEVVISFERGGELHRERFDAALIANGSASTLQPKHLVRYNRPYPWGAMWTIGTFHEELPQIERECLHQCYAGCQYMMGILPSGTLPDAPRRPLYSFFWSLRVREMDRWRTGAVDMHAWRAHAGELWPLAKPLLVPLSHASMLFPAVYRDVILSRWGSGRTGVLGDAAHATSPQLGQGANQALLDAVAVSAAVAASDSWDAVWQHYHTARRGSIRFYQGMSRLLTPLYQSGIPGAGLLRDVAMISSRQLPWLRRQMALTVAGSKHGWLR